MRLAFGGAVLAICLASAALADAPDTSLRPQVRPAPASAETTLDAQADALQPPLRRPLSRPASLVAADVPAAEPPPADLPVAIPPAANPQFAALAVMLAPARPAIPETLRPRARPLVQAAPEVEADPVGPELAQVQGLLSVPRPLARPALRSRPADAPDAEAPERIEQVAAVRILPGKSSVFGRKGSVCGDPAIKGEVLAPVTSRVRGCGIKDAVRVTSVDGVTLNQSAVIDCTTARALKDWVSTGLKPAFGRKEVVALQVMGSYSCRTRNNIKGAPISEHGRGKAVDIGSIRLASGATVSVAGDWRRSAGKPMQKAYRAACGIFGTTLSPDADRYHRDHMHFDTARQRGGAYCR